MNGERKFIIKDISDATIYEGQTVLSGDYQVKNLMAVCQVFKVLSERLKVSRENILDGIRKVSVNTGLAGRWQIIGHNPLIICDTGHNKEGIEYVLNQLKRIPKTSLRMIIGFVNDKDLSSILPLFPHDAVYYFTKASVPRALDENILHGKALGAGLTGEKYPDVKSAMKAALDSSLESDVIFIGGSTFVVGDALL
jgi:dihydrofolate synthase/folylpolyglutamate synthase